MTFQSEGLTGVEKVHKTGKLGKFLLPPKPWSSWESFLFGVLANWTLIPISQNQNQMPTKEKFVKTTHYSGRSS